MISLLFIQMVKYAFSFPVVAMVSHIPVKSRMAVNYVTVILEMHTYMLCIIATL